MCSGRVEDLTAVFLPRHLLTELCFKREPTALLFNQVKMREHLIKDIGNKTTEPVPSLEVEEKNTPSHIYKRYTSILYL